MKKLIAVGLVLVLALSLGAGTVLATPGNGDKPSIDVSKEVEIECTTTLKSTITIKNTSEVPVDVISVTDTVYYKVGPGPWLPVGEQMTIPGSDIPPGETITVTFWFDVWDEIHTEGATELRNKVVVEIEGRDKKFSDRIGIEAPF